MKILSVELNTIAVRESQYPTDRLPEFMIVGRSNVGKSSFINTCINRKNMAHTSSNPGKTQTLNFYLVNNNFYLVDVPGYGYANTSKEVQMKFGTMIEEYIKNRKNLERVFLLIDGRHKIMDDDLLMFNFMKYYKLDVTIVATKCDKINQSERARLEKNINSAFELGKKDSVIYFSSVTKVGKEDVYSCIGKALKKE